ncbi:MAG: hypothetical protein M1812_000016 [Candelaria pacifica]|nr:MAG: hypothetical protein M1812_000016 [Candelaria pacifica]
MTKSEIRVNLSIEPAISEIRIKIPSGSFPFLQLPPELRFMIYEYFKPAYISLFNPPSSSIEGNRSSELLLLKVNKFVYTEAMNVIYSAPVVIGVGISDVVPALTKLSSVARRLIKQLSIRIDSFNLLVPTKSYIIAELNIRDLRLKANEEMWRVPEVQGQLELFRDLDDFILDGYTCYSIPQIMKALALIRAQVLRVPYSARASRLLSLLAPVRFQIYHHLLVVEDGPLRLFSANGSNQPLSLRVVPRHHSKVHLAIFRTNRRIYEEATSVFLAENVFVPYEHSCSIEDVEFLLYLTQFCGLTRHRSLKPRRRSQHPNHFSSISGG